MLFRLALLFAVLPSTVLAGGTLPTIQDNSGSFTYAVPLAVPEGPGGSTPDLALLYSSAGGSGSAGYGWELPYSSIRLEGRWGVPSYWHEGSTYCDGGQYNGRLFLDDMELYPGWQDPLIGVQAEANSWEEAAGDGGDRCVFRTRPDTFSLILPIHDPDGCDPPGSGIHQPNAFVVVRPDGSTWWYGDESSCDGTYRVRTPHKNLGAWAEGSPSSVRELTTRWLLNRVMDRDGNLVQFWPDRRSDPLQDALEAEPSDRGGCDGCLRAVTWAETTRVAPEPPTPTIHEDHASQFFPSPEFASYAGGGITGQGQDFLERPGDFWPSPVLHFYAAMFDWERRPDVRLSFATGGARVSDRRLKQVVVSAGASVVRSGELVDVDLTPATVIRSYRLDYDEGTTGRSRLTRVWELPGVYDPMGAYPTFAIPASSSTWEPASRPPNAPQVPNPWEFVYSDSETLNELGPDGDFVLGDAPETMYFDDWPDSDPWLGASFHEGGFQPVMLSDENGDGLADLLMHDPQLPRYDPFQAGLLGLISPWSDGVINVDHNDSSDLNSGSDEYFVRWNRGTDFSAPEPLRVDPLALQEVDDWNIRHLVQETPSSQAAEEGREVLLEKLANFDSEGDPISETLAGVLYEGLLRESERSEQMHGCVQSELDAMAAGSDTPPEEMPTPRDLDDHKVLGAWLSCAANEAQDDGSLGASFASTGADCDGDGVVDDWGDCIEFALSRDDCAYWQTGIPDLLVHLFGIPTFDPARGAWCEHRSCAPFCEVGTNVTMAVGAVVGFGTGGDGTFVIEREQIHDHSPRPGSEQLVLWNRYANTRASSGDPISTMLDVHGLSKVLPGLEAQTRVRGVDGYSKTSFQTRIRSSHLEVLRNADRKIDGPDAGLSLAAMLNPADSLTVQEGLVHDTFDFNGDGCSDRVVGGAAILESAVTGQEAVLVSGAEFSKELVSSNAHIPFHVSYCEPETGELGPFEAWSMPLEHEWLMGSDPWVRNHIELGVVDADVLETPPDGSYPVNPSADEANWNDPRLFATPYNFNFLAVYEGNTDPSPAGVKAGGGVSVGPGGPSVGASASIGPISFNAGLGASGGSAGIGIGPVSIGTNGFGIGGFSIDFSGKIANSAAGWVLFVLFKLLDTFEVPYGASAGVDLSGVSVSAPLLGGDTLFAPPVVRWKQQGFEDMNGDGLPDYVIAHNPAWPEDPALDELDWVVCINDGKDSCTPTHWPGADTQYMDAALTDLYRHGADGDDVGPNADLTQRRSHQVAGLRDLNGDGLPDFAYSGLRDQQGGCAVAPRDPMPAPNEPAWEWSADYDSLQDHRHLATICVQHNNGHGFEPARDLFPDGGPLANRPFWGHFPALSSSRHHNRQWVVYEDGWGRQLSWLQDINGDGLPDYGEVEIPHGGEGEDGDVRIWLNNGLYFPDSASPGPGSRYGSFHLDIEAINPFQRRPPGAQGALFEGPQWSLDTDEILSRPGGSVIQAAILDLNGDGTLDYAQSVSDGSEHRVKLFPLQTRVPDQLVQIWDPQGSAQRLEYGPARDFMDLPMGDRDVATWGGFELTGSGGYDVYPASTQVVTASTLYDGLGPRGAPAQRVEYRYGTPTYRHGGHPNWPSFWRRSFGWEWVYAQGDEVAVLNQYGPESVPGIQAIGDQITLPAAGLLHQSGTFDADGRLWSHVSRSWSAERFFDIHPDWAHGPELSKANWHLEPLKEVSLVYEPLSGSQPVQNTTWQRRSLLNGLVDCALEDLDADWQPDRADATEWDFGLAADARFNAPRSSSVGRLTQFSEDSPASWCSRSDLDLIRTTAWDRYPSGRVQVEKRFDNSGQNSPPVERSWAYDDRGQPVVEVTPTGGIERSWYDWQSHTRVVEHEGVGNSQVPSIGFRSEAEYCGLNATAACPAAAFGLPLNQIDVNGLRTSTEYDLLGRVASSGDDATGPGTPRTSYRYAWPIRRVGVTQLPENTGGLPAFVRTEAPISAPGWPDEAVWTAAWSDGLGRGVLATTQAVVQDEIGQKASGWQERDTRGRVVDETWPCFGPGEWGEQSDFDLLDPDSPDLGLCAADVRRHTYAYDAADRVTGEVLPNGAVWQRDFRVDTSVNGIAHHDLFTEADGSVIQEVDIVEGPRQKSTTRFGAEFWTHDGAAGPWPSSMTPVAKSLEVVELFDVFGRRIRVERHPEAPGYETTFEYDGWDRLVDYGDPDQGRWAFEFDHTGQLASRYELDRMGAEVRRTEWFRDQRGRVLEELQFDVAAYPFDPVRGWEWAYDQGWTLNGDSGPADAWGLGPVGQPTQAVAWERGGCGEPVDQRIEQTFEWRHDLRGNLVEESQTWEPCFEEGSQMPSTLLSQHAYTASGERYWTRMPLGEQVGVVRDEVGQTLWMGQVPDGGPWSLFDVGEPYLSWASWDEQGRPRELLLGNGVTQVFDFDDTTQDLGALARTAVSSPVDGLLLDRTYWWDGGGNLQRWQEKATAFADAEDFVCSYDGVGSLLGCENPFGTKESFEYRYDASGNLLYERAEFVGHAREAWQYTASGGGLASLGGYEAPLNAPVARVEIGINGPADRASSLTYDHRGQLVGLSHHDGSQIHGSGVVAQEGLANGAGMPWAALADRQLEWDGSGRLRAVRVSTGAAYEDHSSFGYGPGGIRSWEQVLGAEGTTSVMRMGGVADLTEGADGLVLTSHYSVAGRRIAQRSADVALVNGEAVADEVGALRFFAGDHLGSTTLVLDSAGALHSGARYEPFGRIREEFGGGGLGDDYEFAATDRLFNGKLRQREAFGLAGSGFELEGYDYGARIYLPEYGRWASADSITPDIVWEANPYAYVRNNPLKYRDPSGHATESGLEILLDARGEGFIKANTQCMKSWWCGPVFAAPAGVALGMASLPLAPAALGFGLKTSATLGTGWTALMMGAPYSSVAYLEMTASAAAGRVAIAGFGLYAGARTSLSANVVRRFGVALEWTQRARAASVVAPAKRPGSVTIIGRWPAYERLSDLLGARRYHVPMTAWDAMNDVSRWAANRRFLDRGIARNSTFRLASSLREAVNGSYFRREVEYLMARGYRLDWSGSKFLPPKTP